MFDRFGAEARGVVSAAREHARRMGHEWTGCEHILLAVVSSKDPAAAVLENAGVTADAVEDAITAVLGASRGDGDEKAALSALGIDLDRVRDAAETTFGRGALETARASRHRLLRRRTGRRTTCTDRTGRPPFTPRAKRCLELAFRESLRLKHDHVGVAHLAVSLFSKDDTVAWRVLLRLGVAPPDVRRLVYESLRRTA